MAFPPDEVGLVYFRVASQFTLAQSKLVSIFIQTLLYGAYTVVFILTCWVLLYKRPKHEPVNKPMLGFSIVMFVLATMHIGVNYTRILRAFIIYKDEPGGTPAYFNKLSEFTQIFGSAIYVAQTLVGDSVVLYRCYLVWGRQWQVVAFPFILLLGSATAGVGILYSFAVVVPEAEIFVTQLQHWILSFFSVTLATNIICTGLVAYRLWDINRQVKDFGLNHLEAVINPIILLVIESGAIYSATLMTLLILYKTESWFQYVLLDAVSPIVGLVFSMIIVRIGLGLTTMNGQHTYTNGSSRRTPHSGSSDNTRGSVVTQILFTKKGGPTETETEMASVGMYEPENSQPTGKEKQQESQIETTHDIV
ncbi:hypothetical protein DFH08DRAFT_951622 [Mycena albidolilacea]|uniref:Uncharacterized protein n=1 Tax=Mycena albidolilacea TaxID=1033008 RepID=A0AAD7EZG6_9AGAR|nr:hypothetical protein DFH08DRAFT_951622 [Mycena albidolilacea]